MPKFRNIPLRKGKKLYPNVLDDDSIVGPESSTGSIFTGSAMSSKVQTPKFSSKNLLLRRNDEYSVDASEEESVDSVKPVKHNSKVQTETKFAREEDSIGFSVDSYGLPVMKMGRVRQRGAMIGGLPVDDSHTEKQTAKESQEYDLEKGSEYPPAPPKSLWQQRSDEVMPVQSQHRRDSGTSKPPRKVSAVWIIMGVTTILVIGAVVAVAIAVFGGDNSNESKQVPVVLTQRQERLKEIVTTVSGATIIEDQSTPQGKATNWLLFDDQLWLIPGQGTSDERVIQRYALAVFFFATGESAALREGGWLSGDECAAKPWTGLNCYPNEHLVRSLAIDRKNLKGTIPDEIGHLTKMQNFIIKNNEGITGSIPKTIGNLKDLRQIGIYFCNLEGSIPEEVFAATKLEYINFQNNSLAGNLPTKIGELKSLHTLVLNTNKIEGQVPLDTMAGSSLKFLGLSENALTGSIGEVVGKLSSLEYLHLERNKFEGTLPSSLGSITTLKSLSLDHNKFSGGLPTSLQSLEQLEYFSAQSNSLEGPIPEIVGSMKALKTINLDSNAFTGSVPDLTSLVDLQHLLLSRNSLKGPIPSAVTQLKTLETVFLSSNDFTGSIPEFSGTYQIRGLYLSDNKLSGTIAQSICTLTSLEAIFLDENQLEGGIPDCIGNLSKLQQLHLFNNKLSGDIPVDAMTALHELDSLGLESNSGLQGDIPEEFCEKSSTPIEIWADCGGGASAAVSCPCCSVCCPSDECT
ncbi:hypothetical protein FisN_21Lh225 [Fistulifera solaris]|uniref:LRR receptor-like serine/threonine-protein kinase FLS2 n=1 Tax=Fistulifera solaris TaxID=1519565 RepID=A0A1Z5J980_FISSO|nr:hypothetical protein FisN_21Lh225 [Fistulifera solaris]|eukprot:GAX10519.1 hypothetical protein FisN_21Lh225 [Fistulifera solaris]